jgi:hypothetical protein
MLKGYTITKTAVYITAVTLDLGNHLPFTFFFADSMTFWINGAFELRIILIADIGSVR